VRGDPVELDDQADPRPCEIDLVPLDPDAGLGLLDVVSVLEAKEAVLERRSCAVRLCLGRRQQLRRAPARVRVNYGNEGGVVVEVSVLRLRHRPSQGLHVQHIGEVEQGALDGRHRNPAADRDLLRRETAAAMKPDSAAPNPPVPARHGHVDERRIALTQLT